MAWRMKLTREQEARLNDKVVEMLLEDEDPGQLIELLKGAALVDEDGDGK